MKFMRFKKDGYVVGYSELLENNSDFEVFEADENVNHAPAEFQNPDDVPEAEVAEIPAGRVRRVPKTLPDLPAEAPLVTA